VWLWPAWPFILNALHMSEMSGSTNLATQCHLPEGLSPQQHNWGNLKSCILYILGFLVSFLFLTPAFFQNLVSLAQEQIANRENSSKALGGHGHHTTILDRTSSYGGDLPQRSSLPDIPLTPRERQILEQTSSSVLDSHGVGSLSHSQSSESILNDASPPPKPPLPGR